MTKICKRCVMDDEHTEIFFDSKGYCNYCTDAINRKSSTWFNDQQGKEKLERIFNDIKESSSDKEYDCILGLSGGIDSCYTAYLLKQYGLRILAVHIDGGWNTKVSEKNISKLCKKLDIKLHIIKMNREEMYDLQRAYFLAEVPNQDVPQDHIFFTVLYKYALKHKIKYFISGGNFSSECILPECWGHNAMDGANLKDIHKKYGTRKLKEIKPLSFFDVYIKMPYFMGLKKIRPLNYINYNKEDAIKFLNKEFGFEYYGGKHCESIFTRLFQNYILPEKFGINKSKAHYSSLIVSKQISRKNALNELKENEYSNNKKLLEEDINIFIDRIGISREKFDEIMTDGVVRKHTDFKNNNKMINFLVKLKRGLKK